MTSLNPKSTFAGLCLSITLAAAGFCGVFGALPHASAQQDELVTLALEGTSKAETSVEAAREIQASLTTNVAREQVTELVGEKRFQKNKGAIESKIVRQAAKFIPFVNPGQPVQQPDGTWRMPVEMKLSMTSLRKMVLEAGLLSDTEGPASIVPMVAFVDRIKGADRRWWLGQDTSEGQREAQKLLGQLERSFHDRVQAELSKQGFHMIKPLETPSSPLPEALRADRPSQADLAILGDYYKASMVMKGDVRLRENREVSGSYIGTVKLQVVQSATGRLIAEVTRQFATDTGSFDNVVRTKFNAELPDLAKDLSIQVLEAWQRGTINANLVKLTVRGPLNPKQLGEFKGALMKSVREVKGLKERLFERGQVVFEVDYGGDPSGLADRLKGLQMQAFDTKVAGAPDQGLALDVKAR